MAQGNSNRLAGPAALAALAAGVIHDTRVILYKEPGPTPERVANYVQSYVHAKDEDDAAALIAGDGWYRSPDEAHAAVSKSTAKGAKTTEPVPPPPAFKPEVQTILDGLKGKKNDAARVEYAAGLNVDVKGMSEADALAAIGKALSVAA